MASESKAREPFSLHSRLNIFIGIIMMVTGVILILGIALFASRSERTAWQSRQQEASRIAEITVTSFLDEMKSNLGFISTLGDSYFRRNPAALTDLLEANPAFLEVAIFDEAGEVVASASPDSEAVLTNLYTLQLSNWYTTARLGSDYVGDIEISAGDEPYLVIALPTDAYGVIAARLRMDFLWEIVADIQFSETSKTAIFDSSGLLIAHPNTALVLESTSLAGRPEYQAIRADDDHSWSGAYRNYQGTPVIGSARGIPGTDWIILTETARSEAYRLITAAVLSLGGAVGLLSIIASASINRLTKNIVLDPIDDLVDAASIFSEGILDYRVKGDFPLELSHVAEAMNAMATQIEDRENDLRVARDEAQRASEFKSILLSNVSHDLRTPLGGILGMTEMLQEEVYGPIADSQKEPLERIVLNARRLKTLINSMLDQAQIEAGKLELENKPFSPAAVFEEVKEVMGYLAESKGLTFETTVEEGLPDLIMGDERRVFQVIMNLVNNAFKFTTKGSVWTHIYVDRDSWVIVVQDTGKGIPGDSLEAIFEPFRQVDKDTAHQQGGVGLGLSIVHQLVTAMGGRIDVESEVGKGSTFRVKFPLNRVEEA